MKKPLVILLHGIWMPGTVMGRLRHRLESHYGFECRLFDYPSIRGRLDENAALLAEHVRYPDREVALVGHSLGGLISLRMLAHWPDAPVDRLVCLGSPLCGSRAAAAVSRHRWLRPVLGYSLPEAVLSDRDAKWAETAASRIEVGVIAGSRSTGLGKLLAGFEGENDGTVAVSETRLPGIRDHLVLPVSHTGMVFSKAVAEQTAAFLEGGAFIPRSSSG